jgi:hypothetical protein
MEMKMSKKNLIIIILLMLVTGLLIYYLYLKPENFTDPVTIPNTTTSVTCPQATNASLPVSITSRFFGIGFNIYPANNTNQINLPSNIINTNLFLIEHIPVVYNNTLGSMYSISSDGQLTIKLRNDQDPTQWWVLTQQTDTTTPYYVITPFTQSTTVPVALQYENGNLALRPYTAPGFESQKWLTSTNKVTRGIPVLNYNPASMFTPEFDPYSSTNTISSSSLAQQNSQQVNDVLSSIKANIQQYLTQIGAQQNIPQPTGSTLGNKDQPLNINVSLSGIASSNAGSTIPGGSTLSAFANIDGTTTPNDILSLLNKYETTTGVGASNSQTLYSTTDLQNSLQSNNGCSTINICDYTSNRVSSCNCKL